MQGFTSTWSSSSKFSSRSTNVLSDRDSEDFNRSCRGDLRTDCCSPPTDQQAGTTGSRLVLSPRHRKGEVGTLGPREVRIKTTCAHRVGNEVDADEGDTRLSCVYRLIDLKSLIWRGLGRLFGTANAAVNAEGTIPAILYRRLVPRLGHAQAIGAIAHLLCRLICKRQLDPCVPIPPLLLTSV
jgi:hypothetical protein